MSAWGPHERAGVGTVQVSVVRAVHAHPAGVHGPGECMHVCVGIQQARTQAGVGIQWAWACGDPAGMGVRGSSGHRWACMGIQQAWACGDLAGTDMHA